MASAIYEDGGVRIRDTRCARVNQAARATRTKKPAYCGRPMSVCAALSGKDQRDAKRQTEWRTTRRSRH